jgi:proline dehydrogenase
MERLMRDGEYPALATHDERLIRRATAFAEREGIGPERFEFQMLFGVRRDLQDRLVRDGWSVRVYVPYGREWYPYFMRRLAERPANVAFILRSVLREGRGGDPR